MTLDVAVKGTHSAEVDVLGDGWDPRRMVIRVADERPRMPP